MSDSAAITQLISTWPKLASFSLTSPACGVLHLQIATNKMNTMTQAFWHELYQVNQLIHQAINHIRVVVISGQGRCFSAGLDLSDHAQLFTQPMSTPLEKSNAVDAGREALQKLGFIEAYQRSMTSIEALHQPVISFIHGHCVGGAIDLIAACDIRYAVKSTSFSIKEVDVGMSADVGTLQRIERITGNASLVRDWALTARSFDTHEAVTAGLIHPQTFDTYDTGLKSVIDIASLIASKSPIAIVGTKRMLNYARNHSIADSLEAHAVWNAAMLQSNDVERAIKGAMTKQKPIFAKL